MADKPFIPGQELAAAGDVLSQFARQKDAATGDQAVLPVADRRLFCLLVQNNTRHGGKPAETAESLARFVSAIRVTLQEYQNR